MTGALRVVWAGAAAQLRGFMAAPADFLGSVVLSPIVVSIFFFLFLQIAGRLDTLVAFAVVAPGLSAVWSAALTIAGETIDSERWQGTLEPLVIAPQNGLLFSVTGRILATSFFSLVGMLEAILVGRLIFDAPIVVYQPLAFTVILILTTLSVAAAGVIMASTFVLARSVRLFQNVLSTPFLLLGGVAFPVAVLPLWLQPFSSVISLSWGASGLRQALMIEPVSWLPFVMLPLLTVVYGTIGYMLLIRIERRIRATGAVGAS